MASGRQVGTQCPSPGSTSIPVAVYGHVSVGLGSPPVGSDGLGGGVPGREFVAHHCAGDEGGVSGSGCHSAPAVRSECRLSLSPASGSTYHLACVALLPR